MFHALGKFVSQYWWFVILAWLTLLLGLKAVAPPWEDVVNDGDLAYLPPQMTSQRGQALLREAFPGPSPLLVAEEITLWPEFCGALVEQAEAGQENVGKRVFELLTPEVIELIRLEAEGEWLTREERDEIVSGLNGVLSRPDFYHPAYFREVKLEPAIRELEDQVLGETAPLERELQLYNRLLLEAAYHDYLPRAQRGYAKSQMVFIVERPNGPLQEADFAVADRLAERFSPDALPEAPIVAQWTRHSPIIGDRLISDDRQAVLVINSLSTEFMATENRHIIRNAAQMLEEVRSEAAFPQGLNVAVSGSAAIGGDMMASSEESIKNTERATVILVLVILLIVYRAPMLVLIPLTTIIVSVLVAMRSVAILAVNPYFEYQVFTTSKVFIVVILFGAGTDFCLFLISRYKEELAHTTDRGLAVARALGNVGHALAASAFTTVGGLGVMWFADFGKFHFSGPTIGLCLLVALAACLTLAPALLRMFGKIVFWPFGKRVFDPATRKRVEERSKRGLKGFWAWTSRQIIARPGLVLVLSVAALLPLAQHGVDVEVTYDLLNALGSDRPSKQGTAVLRQHFHSGDISPITILAYSPQGEFDSKEGRKQIARLTKRLYDIRTEEPCGDETLVRGVREVRSFAEPLGGTPGVYNPFSRAGRLKMAALKHPKTRERYVDPTGTLTRFEVVLSEDPFSKESQQWLEKIEAVLLAEASDPQSAWSGVDFDLVGVTAGIRDLKEVTTSDQDLIRPLVVISVFAILIILLRNPVVCGILMVSVLFSYFVSMGVTVHVFQMVYPDTFQGLDWKVPLFLFVLLVAIGMDYNIYLITRVVEEQKRSGLIDGIRDAMVHTGGIITSCGIIMAGTFLSMMTGTLRGIQQLGFALSFGVLLDTFFIRTLLVPAFLALYFGSILPLLRRMLGLKELSEGSEQRFRPGTCTAGSGPHVRSTEKRIAEETVSGHGEF